MAAAAGAAAGALPAVPTLSLEEAVLAVCGVDAETAAAAYAAAAGEAADSSAARAALAAALAPKPPPRVTTAAEQAAVEAEVFGAKGRVLNAEAGARWLIQWCSKVTGGATGGDDTVATAVCRLLLSGARGVLGLAGFVRGLVGGRGAAGVALACPTVACLHLRRYQPPSIRMPRCGVCSDCSPAAGRSDDEVAAELFDLLGDSVFEHIGERFHRFVGVDSSDPADLAGFSSTLAGLLCGSQQCSGQPLCLAAVHATPPAALRHNAAPHRRSHSCRRAAAAARLGSLQCAAPCGRLSGG